MRNLIFLVFAVCCYVCFFDGSDNRFRSALIVIVEDGRVVVDTFLYDGFRIFGVFPDGVGDGFGRTDVGVSIIAFAHAGVVGPVLAGVHGVHFS